MSKGEIIIKEATCLGCGYCETFCPRDCIAITGDRFSPLGYLLPVFADPGRCDACGICAWMCPHFSIEVYKYVDSTAAESD